MTVTNAKLYASLCAVSAFFPLLITALGIHADMELSERGMLFNPINLAAFLWLGLTVLYYRHIRTKSAAWLFALFPIAFAEPVLLFCLWCSVRFSPK
ncbi:MAG TPA: hypothetical protein VKP61_10780 [Candidatus Acidoferrum sp.]|nr:hypothetical protein [Candidatus Acidoferrum sp.]